jgi:hypothetical protein
VPSACHVNLSVYDLLGREVAMLANEEKPAGNYRISWDATKMASGIYLYTLSAGAFKETKKMLLVR